LGPQGVKAKYVRVELRKIETIPGVPPNSYYDFVGQSPVNLWRSSEEYSLLHSVRTIVTALFLSLSYFLLSLLSKTFLSIFGYPSPSPQLSRLKTVVRSISRPFRASPDLWRFQAGIKYELVGQVCIRSKSYVSPLMSLARIGTYTFPDTVDSSDATSQSFFLPLPQSSSTSTNFIPLGRSFSNMNHAISPKMP
jgi:hypothetical protein